MFNMIKKERELCILLYLLSYDNRGAWQRSRVTWQQAFNLSSYVGCRSKISTFNGHYTPEVKWELVKALIPRLQISLYWYYWAYYLIEIFILGHCHNFIRCKKFSVYCNWRNPRVRQNYNYRYSFGFCAVQIHCKLSTIWRLINANNRFRIVERFEQNVYRLNKATSGSLILALH